MFTKLIYRDVNFHIYDINEHGTIKMNNLVLDDRTILHKSSNGYMYVLLQRFGGSFAFYPLDKVIYNSFHPDTLSVLEHFKCIHIDGNNFNNDLSNIEAVQDLEEWRDVTYPNVEPGICKVSSYGRVSKTFATGKTEISFGGFSAHIHESNYMIRNVYLPTFNSVKNDYSRSKCYPLHRLIANEFLGTITPDEVVNHIDGNPMNNYIDNLEITTQEYNISHGVLIHSNNRTVSNETWFAMEAALIKFKGNMMKTLQYMLANGYNVTHKQITHAKYDFFKRRKYLNLDTYYDKFETKDYRDIHSDDVVIIICKTLCDNNGNVNKTLKQLQAMNYDIEEYDIKNIKYKNTFARISDNYFTFSNREFVKL